MTTHDLYIQSMLAKAGYANLQTGTPNTQALIDVGMGGAQANDFAIKWIVVDQYNDTSGVGASVFQEIASGAKYRAIRDTHPTDVSNLNADYILAQSFPSFLNPQFILFIYTLNAWLTNNVFPNMITNNKWRLAA